MRKVIQLLINKFGGHLNSDINVLVSGWYHNEFKLFDMSINLRDVPEDDVVRTLESTIENLSLTFANLQQINLVPALNKNGCDLNVKVLACPELITTRLIDVATVSWGYWKEGDKVAIGNANEHIAIKKTKRKGNVEGLYLNGTMNESGELFSFYLNGIEVSAIFKQLISQFNGVEILDEGVKQSIVAKAIFYRMIDSDIGFHIEMSSPDVYRWIKEMVWVRDADKCAEAESADVFSTRGYKIGVAFKRFNIRDIKQAELSQKTKPALVVVVNNDESFEKKDSRDDRFDEEVATEWGMY